VDTSALLRAQGLFVPAIRYPAVARGRARLRLTVTAGHSPADISTLTGALHDLGIGF
jgi:7-keto-8-aminopelargonate synthetase-like enzyme